MNQNWAVLILLGLCLALLFDRSCNIQNIETSENKIKALQSEVDALQLQRNEGYREIEMLKSKLKETKKNDTIIKTKYIIQKAHIDSISDDSLVLFIRSKL